ncbi:PIN domain-containing protein [Nakamurella aerolata]|uniref:Ribonuclease VapC n=1 Tax=Nakamurella aerolata TaxID=1656892 RepID=A0A849A1I8_9ACTN|nr:type II toxin-antitoxin system VapC family toxin [Nakamurella aerolata]
MIVLDASALVDAVADRPHRDAVLAHLDQRIAAPAHQLAEVTSAISRLHRADELSAAAARRALKEAATLTQQVFPLDEALLLRAFELRAAIRVLDGLYVALAERLACPLLTTDARLARAEPLCEVIRAGS